MNVETMIDAVPRLFDGLGVTLLLAGVTLILGLIFAIPLGVIRARGSRLLSAVIQVYTFCFRGTPLLVQLYLIYYGSGQFRPELEAAGFWWFFRDPWNCAFLGYTLSTTAYTTEIIRGAILAVPRGEIEASIAFGMGPFTRLRLVILPQAFGYALPSYSNEVVFQIQATALVSLITLPDITGIATVLANRTYQHYELYLTAALFYLVLVYAVLLVLKAVEARLTRHRRAH